MEIRLETPVEDASNLNVGDVVYLSGSVLTMRDRAHMRALEHLERGEELPFDLKNQVVWHCGPIVKNNKVIAAGPTTSGRMDASGAELMEKLGFKLVIGKGGMGLKMQEALKNWNGAYLAQTGGCAALFGQKTSAVEAVYWEDLGMAEAVWKLKIEDFGPLFVAMDAKGNSLY